MTANRTPRRVIGGPAWLDVQRFEERVTAAISGDHQLSLDKPPARPGWHRIEVSLTNRRALCWRGTGV